VLCSFSHTFLLQTFISFFHTKLKERSLGYLSLKWKSAFSQMCCNRCSL